MAGAGVGAGVLAVDPLAGTVVGATGVGLTEIGVGETLVGAVAGTGTGTGVGFSDLGSSAGLLGV